MRQVDALAPFIASLTEHYGARESHNVNGHRQFSNPWGPGFIFIRKGDARVSYGHSITRSQWMTDAMVARVATRQMSLPKSPVAETEKPGPIGIRPVKP
jgi:hypothetical protein